MVVAVLWPQSVISSSASGGEVVAVHTLASVVAEPLCLSAFERCAQENVGPSPSKTLQLNEVNLTAGRSLLRIWLFLTMLSLFLFLFFSFCFSLLAGTVINCHSLPNSSRHLLTHWTCACISFLFKFFLYILQAIDFGTFGTNGGYRGDDAWFTKQMIWHD